MTTTAHLFRLLTAHGCFRGTERRLYFYCSRDGILYTVSDHMGSPFFKLARTLTVGMNDRALSDAVQLLIQERGSAPPLVLLRDRDPVAVRHIRGLDGQQR